MKLYKHEKLQEALDLFVRQQNDLLPDDETVAAVTFSDAFKERMQKLLRRERNGFFVLFGTAGRRVASILIAIFVAATVTTVSVDALREPVFQFFTEVFEKFTQVFFVTNPEDFVQETFEKRAPSLVPEGYEIEREEFFAVAYRITYINSQNNNRIRYNQRMKDSNELIADTEAVEYQEIDIGSIRGITYKNKGTSYIVFADEQYVFSISGETYDELLKIAESVWIE